MPENLPHLLFEDDSAVDLRPLTFTRPVWDLRFGIGTLAEKWARAWGYPAGSLPPRRAVGHLAEKFDAHAPAAEALCVNGKVAPTPDLIDALELLGPGEGYLLSEDELLAFRGAPKTLLKPDAYVGLDTLRKDLKLQVYPRTEALHVLRHPADLFRLNGEQLRRDFPVVTAGRTSQPITDPHTAAYNPEAIFLETGVSIKAAVLDATDGPIYLGPHTTLMPGSLVLGAHAIEAHSTVNAGAKLRGDSTIGPWCKVGGEVANSVVWGYSNKAHDGYLGNSVVGQWCNLGAATDISNLKNNYSTVHVFNYRAEALLDTGLLFHGLVFADHAKTAIHTQFNTGTVVGVMANVFGTGVPAKHVPDFTWGGSTTPGNGVGVAKPGIWDTHDFAKACALAERVMARRQVAFLPEDQAILAAIFEATAHLRRAARA